MGKVGTGIAIALGITAIACGTTFGGLHINKQNKDIKAKSAEIVKVTEDYQNSKNQVILLQSDNKKYEEQLAQKDEAIASKDATIASKDAEITQKNTELASKEATIAEQNQQLTQKDEAIANKDAEIAQKNQQIEDLQASANVIYTSSSYPSIYLNSYDYLDCVEGSNIVYPASSINSFKTGVHGLGIRHNDIFTLGDKYAMSSTIETLVVSTDCVRTFKILDRNGVEFLGELPENIGGYMVSPNVQYSLNEEGWVISMNIEFTLLNCLVLEDGSLLQPCQLSDWTENIGYYSFNELQNGVSGFYITEGDFRYYTTDSILGNEGVYGIIREAPSISTAVQVMTNGTNYYLEFTRVGNTEPTLLKLENLNHQGI